MAVQPRRTQAERRATTRAALLDAAIECLVEDGYVNLTTRRVAERAGVSQGTQMHYFPTKTAFVAEAVHYVAERVADDVRLKLRAAPNKPDFKTVIDMLWKIHRGPAFQSALELMAAAGTDLELRDSLRELERRIARTLVTTSAELFPEEAGDPRYLALVGTALAAIRGLAIMPPVMTDRQVTRQWKATRGHLLQLAESLQT